tara:strand:- start:272 stop:433 length:162 start_codon:yes stop_codon:yes gene_type:complete
MKCVICKVVFEGYGNNAEPIRKGICCDDCNQKVILPIRLSQLAKGELKGELYS